MQVPEWRAAGDRNHRIARARSVVSAPTFVSTFNDNDVVVQRQRYRSSTMGGESEQLERFQLLWLFERDDSQTFGSRAAGRVAPSRGFAFRGPGPDPLFRSADRDSRHL